MNCVTIMMMMMMVVVIIIVVVVVIIIIIIIIIIICFYELQYTYCNMKPSTLLVILIHNMTHNMLHKCFSKFITPDFTRIKGFGIQKEITVQLLTSSAVQDTIYTQHTCWLKQNATILCVQNFL